MRGISEGELKLIIATIQPIGKKFPVEKIFLSVPVQRVKGQRSAITIS